VPETSIQRSLAAVDPDVSVNDLEPVVSESACLSALQGYSTDGICDSGVAAGCGRAVLSHLVSGRIREIGVRMALGATQREVLRMVVQEGMFPAIVGVVPGLGAAFGLTRMLSAMLYGVSPTDPVTLTSALLTSALFATWFPAWRATAVDPMVALRYG
jgi:putative ABC transport system permease protein